jgi:hypothetical protein
MSAAFIMLTSFEPSPIARVVLFLYRSFIIRTIFAFYFGETLLAITESALSQRSMSLYCRKSDSYILFKVAPVIITVMLNYLSNSYSYSLKRLKASFNFFLILNKVLQSNRISSAPS